MSSDRSNCDLADNGAGSSESGDESADPDGTSDRRSAAPAVSSASVRCDLQIQNPCGYPDVAARRLRPWLEDVLAELAPSAASATVRFVSDREMKSLNREYRGFDKTTDVLSFPGDMPENLLELSGQGPHLGDVVISVPTARRQAKSGGHSSRGHRSRGHTVARELRLLALHGILHCLGYDHETDDGTMERVEAELRLRLLGEAV